MLRNPDSIPKGDTIIEDPVMEPFFITKSQAGGYTLYERVIKGENNTPYIKTICYPGRFSYALKAVAEQMLNRSNDGHYNSVKQYITEYNNIQKKLTDIVAI